MTVDMNKTDKIREGQIQINGKHNSRRLIEPILKEINSKVMMMHIINYRSTLSTPNPPRIPEFYTLKN